MAGSNYGTMATDAEQARLLPSSPQGSPCRCKCGCADAISGMAHATSETSLTSTEVFNERSELATEAETNQPPHPIRVRTGADDDDDDNNKWQLAGGARKGWSAWLSDEIAPSAAVPAMLVVSFSTSLLDSIMLSIYSCFATNQTGNTILLALATHHRGRKLTLTATSMAGFVGAGLVFGQLGARCGHRKRGWILFSLVYQTILLFLFSFMVSPSAPIQLQQYGSYEWISMLVAAVQGGPQIVMGTTIEPLMPTGMVTSVIVGVLSDPKLFFWGRSRVRDLRVVYLATFVSGALAGLAIEQVTSAWFSSLMSAILKVIAIGMVAYIK